MKKWSLAIAFTAIFSLGAFAQTEPFMDTATNKWGVKNNGNIIVQPEYTYIRDFIDGLSVATKGTESGVIDTSGKVIVPFGKYSFIKSFSEGVATVTQGEKSGFIDITGKEIIPLQYSYAGYFQEGLASAEVGGKLGYIDKNNKMVIPFKYGYTDPFHEGLASVAIDGWWDFDIYMDGKWGVVNKTGQEIVPLKYDYVGPFSGGVAQVNIGGEWDYDDIEAPAIFGGKWGVIDKTGKEIIPLKYDYLFTGNFKKYGYILVSSGTKYGLVNGTGIAITPIKYDFVRPSSTQPDIAVVNIGGTYDDLWGDMVFNPYVGGNQGFINIKTGKEITSVQYATVSDFNEGLAMVNMGAVYDGAGYKGGKWGYIDAAGKTIIPLKYDTADYFFDGKAKVSMGGREFYIDKTGKEVK